ncbi:MAG: hypothetical protein JWL64_178 [Frankiales bacterium]|nr:hypothetical protein [Frankiales bacterium]
MEEPRPVDDQSVMQTSGDSAAPIVDPALQSCVEDGSLELMYQPEVDLATGTIVGMEALLRWHHGDLGLLGPADFLTAAEDSGGAGPIADWVLAKGATEVASWSTLTGGGVPLWLNVGLGQLRSGDLDDRVVFELAGHDLPAGRLGLELNESVLNALGADALPLLLDLRRAGVLLAVDHVTAWSALLDTLPLSGIKLARSFVDAGETAAVAAVLAAAHGRDLYVVAEGVETREVARRMADLGCDRAYGWLFSSAQRADKARWLASQPSDWQGNVLAMAASPA